MRQIVLDTETTGLETTQGHRIIEIGCVEMVNRRLTHNHFHHYLQPDRAIDAQASNVHGITDAFLKDKPRFADIVVELIDFIKDAELIIHNADFDVSFINHELHLLHNNWQSVEYYCRILDTLALARRYHPGQKNSLDALCKRYHIDNTKRQLHGALLDAALLAEVYLAMTGGQVSLLAIDEQSETQHVDTLQRMSTQRAALPLIEPTIEELHAHEQFLAQMEQACGQECLWKRMEAKNCE
ncbi:MAG: DNA polymerase III subunit epsilon [Pseudomonadota bacterium]|nr:DNA polymerase III subunit epsilon [Pseudomonadota bacterium]